MTDRDDREDADAINEAREMGHVAKREEGRE